MILSFNGNFLRFFCTCHLKVLQIPCILCQIHHFRQNRPSPRDPVSYLIWILAKRSIFVTSEGATFNNSVQGSLHLAIFAIFHGALSLSYCTQVKALTNFRQFAFFLSKSPLSKGPLLVSNLNICQPDSKFLPDFFVKFNVFVRFAIFLNFSSLQGALFVIAFKFFFSLLWRFFFWPD